ALAAIWVVAGPVGPGRRGRPTDFAGRERGGSARWAVREVEVDGTGRGVRGGTGADLATPDRGGVDLAVATGVRGGIGGGTEFPGVPAGKGLREGLSPGPVGLVFKGDGLLLGGGHGVEPLGGYRGRPQGQLNALFDLPDTLGPDPVQVQP